MSRKPQYAEFDWADCTPRASRMVRVNPKRKRRPTLASARKQAEKAGLNVTGALVTADGVKLEFGGSNSSSQSLTANPWDEVLTDATH